MRRKLAEKIEREKEEEQRAKEEAAERARRNRPKTREEIESRRKLALAALALAVSRGRTWATLGDYRECNGVPRLVLESRKNVCDELLGVPVRLWDRWKSSRRRNGRVLLREVDPDAGGVVARYNITTSL